MLVDDESPEQGIREASQLMDQLGIQPEQLIEGAYLDLMLAQGLMPDRDRRCGSGILGRPCASSWRS